MQNYALLRILAGKCNSMGLAEIKFQYPLKTDREKELHKKALEKITVDRFQLGFYWSLVEEYQATLEKCRIISGDCPEPVFIPDDIMHGEIQFTVNYRFDGYSPIDKEKLVATIIEGGILPRTDALDFTYRFMSREMEVLGGHVDKEKLAYEQRATIARNLSFHSE